MTYTGPFPFDNTGTIDGILVATSFTGRVTNDGTITTGGIDVVGSTITGLIKSDSILAGGINVDRGSSIVADPADIGIWVHAGSFAGGIHNGGSLSGGSGIDVDFGATFSGVITNTGTISTSGFGIFVNNNASIFDSGIISAPGTAISFGGRNNTLTLASGYNITGLVAGAPGSSTLQLGGSGSDTFDPSKIGSAAQYRGFATFNVIGGIWKLTAAAAESWSIKAGTLELGSGSTIVNQTITFAGSGATLQIDTAMSQISGTMLASAMIGDAIDLRYQAYTAGMHAVWTHNDDAHGQLVLKASNGTSLATFNLIGVYDTAQFQAVDDTHGGTVIQITAPLLSTLSANNSPPTLVVNQPVSLSSLLNVIDPDGVGYRQLKLWDDAGGAGGRFVFNNASLATNQTFVFTPAQASTVTFKAAPVGGTDSLWAQLVENDGSLSSWLHFTETMEASVTVHSTAGGSPGQALRVLAAGFVTVPDPSGVGYQQLRLWDSAGGTNGRFMLNGSALPVSQEIDLTPAQAAAVTFTTASAAFGGGTDTLWAQLLETDGTLTPWQSFTIAVAPPLTMYSIAAATPSSLYNVVSTFVGGSNLGSATPQQLQLWDSVGGAGGRFEVNGATQNPGQEIDLNFSDAAFNNATFLSSQVAGTDRLSARLKLTDGTLTPWVSFTVTVAEPSVTTHSVAAAAKSTSINLLGASGLLTINDPSAIGYTQLHLWDSSGGADGRFMLNGSAFPVGQEIDLTRTQAATATFTAASGVGTDTLWAQLLENDGTLTPWQSFTVTVPQPTLTVFTLTVGKNNDTGMSGLARINDPGNVSYRKLELWDSAGGEGGHFYIGGSATPAPEGQEIDVPPGVSWTFKTGSIGGRDTVWAQLMLNDGTETGWQKTSAFVPQPTVSALQTTTTATEGQSINLSSLISISDPVGVGYQSLELWQGVGGPGQFVVSGMTQTANHTIDVSPADFSDTVFTAGTVAGGTDQLWAQLKQNDGTFTGWTPVFNVAVAPAPTISVHNFSGADAGQFIPLSSMVTVADPGHENYQTMELWDGVGTVGGGVFVVNGAGQTTNHTIDVSLTDAAITGFFAGSAGVTDTLWAQLKQNDGTTTGWQQFTVSTHT